MKTDGSNQTRCAIIVFDAIYTGNCYASIMFKKFEHRLKFREMHARKKVDLYRTKTNGEQK